MKYFEDFEDKENFHAGSMPCYQYYARYREHSNSYLEPVWTLPSHDTCKHDFKSVWTKEKVCATLHGQKILIVGDSMQVHFFQTMMLMLTGDTCITTVLCENSTEINFYFLRNDFLSIHGITHLNKTASNGDTIAVNHEWAPDIVEKNITLLFINRGVHYVDDYVLYERLDTVFNYLVTNHPNLTIIYRSTPSGHPHACTKLNNINWFDTFQITSKNITNYYESLQEEPYFGYHWIDFQQQNNMTRDLILQKYPTIIYLDWQPMTLSRSDHHSCKWGDELHYCFHSVTDWWVILFFNLIHLGKQFSKLEVNELLIEDTYSREALFSQINMTN